MGEAHIINDYIAGAIGGSAGLIIGHPFDTTKVQLQTRQTSSPYKGAWDAIKNINQSGMTRGFFRGLGFPLVSYGVVNSVFFGVYGNALTYMKGADRDRTMTYSEVFLAGCAGGFMQLLVACPVDVVKVVLQSQIKKTGEAASTSSLKYFQGPVDCVSWIYKQHGVRGLYYGYWLMALRDVPTFGVYTVTYNACSDVIKYAGIHDRNGVFTSLVAGGMAGVTCWTLAIPFDVVKSTLQADPHQTRHKNALDCARYLYKARGVNAFFTGLGVTCLRAFPCNAVTFLGYEQTLKYLRTHPIIEVS